VVLGKTSHQVVILGNGIIDSESLEVFLMECEVGADVTEYNRVQSRYSGPIYKQIKTLYHLPHDSDLLFA
jgi:hypothetical protein